MVAVAVQQQATVIRIVEPVPESVVLVAGVQHAKTQVMELGQNRARISCVPRRNKLICKEVVLGVNDNLIRYATSFYYYPSSIKK
jgi:hypothetical protein